MSEGITVKAIMDAAAKLPQRDPDSREVRWGSGEIAFDLPIPKIAMAVIAGFVEWDASSQRLYLTPRAEQAMHNAGAARPPTWP